jgi:hypothetical protein
MVGHGDVLPKLNGTSLVRCHHLLKTSGPVAGDGPRRTRTRHQEQQDRITAERRLNEARIAEEQRRHQAWLAATYEPPPF